DAPERRTVAPDDLEAVPAWCGWDFARQIEPALAKAGAGRELRCSFGPERLVVVPGDPLSRSFLRAIDGEKTVAEVLAAGSRAASTVSASRVMRRWVEFAEEFRAVAALTLFAPEG